MQRIKSFLPGGNTSGLHVGQVIPESWVDWDPANTADNGRCHWVTPLGESPIYGWCELEEVPAEKPRVAEHSTDLVKLGALAGRLGPRAMALLVALAARLAKGAEEHGDFEAPSKPLVREALEEHLDAVIYLAKELHDTEPSRG